MYLYYKELSVAQQGKHKQRSRGKIALEKQAKRSVQVIRQAENTTDKRHTKTSKASE